MPGELPFPPAQRMRRNYCTFLTEGDLISASLGSISVRPQVPVYCPPHRSSAPGALWREMQLPGHFSANRGTNESKMSRRKWTKRQIYHFSRNDKKVKVMVQRGGAGRPSVAGQRSPGRAGTWHGNKPASRAAKNFSLFFFSQVWYGPGKIFLLSLRSPLTPDSGRARGGQPKPPEPTSADRHFLF